ncbi:MAG: siderophore-interacting protein [Steroidobacteraceae bacterium]
MVSTNRGIERIRHQARTRVLTVKRVKQITPHMVCVTLTGDLQGFISASYDDHVKLFFPAPGSVDPILPQQQSGSHAAIPSPTPIGRDYTPRRYDVTANELDIEFVLHSEGPATSWAAQVQVGQHLGVGGPRGSFVVTGDFDWYLLVADEVGLPALARRLQELPAHAQAFVIVEVEDANDEQILTTTAQVKITWVHRQGRAAGTADLLQGALSKLPLLVGEGYTWIACESNVARSVRNYLIDERGLNKKWIKAAGYWKQGASAAHEKHED